MIVTKHEQSLKKKYSSKRNKDTKQLRVTGRNYTVSIIKDDEGFYRKPKESETRSVGRIPFISGVTNTNVDDSLDSSEEIDSRWSSVSKR